MGRSMASGVWLSAPLLAAVLLGCGQETVRVSDTTPPYVLSTVPTQGADELALDTPISATFSKAVLPSTIGAASFTVASAAGPIAGTVTLTGNTATFAAAAVLLQDTVYTGTITTGVKDLAGNPMVQNYVWTFETTEVPSVVSTSPANGQLGVGINQPISATFLQDPDSPGAQLNCATVSAASFLLTGPSGPVAGKVKCVGSVATFTPAVYLTMLTSYTATITPAVQNAAGNGLGAPYVWTFLTNGQPRVTATSPAKGATGVLLTQDIVATFNTTMSCETLYTPATSFTLNGPGGAPIAGMVNCTGKVATFSPALPLAPNTSYISEVSTAATDREGEPLVANYFWSFRTVPAPTPPTVISTYPANNDAGVPTNQKLAATFSEAMDPASIDGLTFTVTGPGGAATGIVTYTASGSVATFATVPALAANTVYVATITTGAQDIGQPPTTLDAAYSWTFTTGAETDTTPPLVVAMIPADADMGVPLTRALSATFNKAMDPATIDGTTFLVTAPDGTAVPGNVTYAAIADSATFTPDAALTPATLYTATLTSANADLAGNNLASDFVWTFTTGAAADTDPPSIVSTGPANAATGVPIDSGIAATFSKAMDPLTFSTSTFQVTGPGGVPIAGTVAYDSVNFVATFIPRANLASNTSYVTTISAAVADLSGNTKVAGAAPDPWFFTTGGVPSPGAAPEPKR